MNFIILVNKIATILFIISFLLFSYRLIFIFYAFKKEKPLKKTNKFAKFAILIPARNESKVITKLFNSIKKQDYNKNLIDVYVITEHINDPTNKIAENFGFNYFIRKDLKNKRTKGYALNEVVKEIYKRNIKYDAFFIFDADNILKENFITEMNKVYQSGIEVAMAYRNTVNIHDNWVATCSALMFSNTNTFQNKARNYLTKSIVISGTGYYISSKILDKFKGFPFNSLTEDYEITNYLVVNNIKSKYVTTTEFYDEQPTDLKTLNNQRVRWCKGYFNNYKKYTNISCKKILNLKNKNINKKAILETRLSLLPNLFYIISFIIYSLIQIGILTYGFFIGNFLISEICFKNLIKLVFSYYLIIDIYTIMQLICERKKFKLNLKEIINCLLLNPLFIFMFIFHAVKAIITKNVSWKVIKHNSNNFNNENLINNKEEFKENYE